MDALAGLSFRSPLLLWLLLAVPFVLLVLSRRERERRLASERFVSERLRGRDRYRAGRPVVISLALALTFLALAGPRFGSETIDVPRRESNLVIALDISSSMDAEDVGTSRLTAAKSIVRRLAAESGRSGLVVFEGVSQVVSPLTSDQDALVALVDTVRTGELSEPGSDLGGAVSESLRIARAGVGAVAHVVLISDGEEQGGGGVDQAIRQAKTSEVPISTIMIGTEAGAKIPMAPGRFLKDESGNEVITRARPSDMRMIAESTGGKFHANPFSERAMREILSELRMRGAGSEEDEQVHVPIERYQWPLGAAFFAFVLGSLLNRGAE
ncbi:MAG TPA: VWA domain-containing protein [Thermoanaerobaculia bacterium]|nr:VWA domain-containing protein [Thermoanaerobaculia bacterium]